MDERRGAANVPHGDAWILVLREESMSQTAEMNAAPAANPYLGPGITLETKLMKQYRMASLVNAGGQGIAVGNKDGQVELFTLGTKGIVWNISPDRSSDTGYRRKNTGLKVEGDAMRLGRGAIAAGMDHDGKIVVFALSGLGRHGLIDGLNYTVKNPDGSFAAAKPVDLPQQSSSRGPLPVQNIYQIHARTIDGKLYVAVMGLTGLPSAIAQMPYLALSNWSDN